MWCIFFWTLLISYNRLAALRLIMMYICIFNSLKPTPPPPWHGRMRPMWRAHSPQGFSNMNDIAAQNFPMWMTPPRKVFPYEWNRRARLSIIVVLQLHTLRGRLGLFHAFLPLFLPFWRNWFLYVSVFFVSFQKSSTVLQCSIIQDFVGTCLWTIIHSSLTGWFLYIFSDFRRLLNHYPSFFYHSIAVGGFHCQIHYSYGCWSREANLFYHPSWLSHTFLVRRMLLDHHCIIHSSVKGTMPPSFQVWNHKAFKDDWRKNAKMQRC